MAFRLTVATFNIRYGTAADGPNHWDRRWRLAGDAAAGLKADVLCVQECLPFQAGHLVHVLPGYQWVGVGRDDGKWAHGEMTPIFWNADRLEVIDAGHYWLSQEPHVPGSRGWDAKHPRVVTWAVLGPRDDPLTIFHVFNAHFDFDGAQAREQSARLVHRRATTVGPHMPVVVAGDFNCVDTDPSYRALTADRFEVGDALVDVYRAAHPEAGPEDGTFHDFTGRRDGRRIDWVLATPHWKVVGCRIDRTADGDRYPSDHFPVVAELELG
jgi:endonuclease/exonuclease/phosphatase family metal-dependent hydrolase